MREAGYRVKSNVRPKYLPRLRFCFVLRPLRRAPSCRIHRVKALDGEWRKLINISKQTGWLSGVATNGTPVFISPSSKINMPSPHKRFRFVFFSVLLCALCASDAEAIRYQPRPDWTIGFGFGVGRGKFENIPGTIFYEVDGQYSEYRRGVTPEIHFGRALGDHFQVSASYEGWLTEFGVVRAEDADKIRRTVQNLSLAFAVFPGNQRDASGGIFLRAGAGLGWVGTGYKEVFVDVAQSEGEREDDWGWVAFGEGGYEFWVSKNATAGLSATFNYLDVSGDHFVTSAWFAAVAMNFNVYW